MKPLIVMIAALFSTATMGEDFCILEGELNSPYAALSIETDWAVERWLEVTPIIVRPVIESIELSRQEMCAMARQGPNCNVVGMAWIGRMGPIYTVYGATNSVVIHEVGHALGLRHLSYRRDVMYPVPTAVKLSGNDVRAIRSIY